MKEDRYSLRQWKDVRDIAEKQIPMAVSGVSLELFWNISKSPCTNEVNSQSISSDKRQERTY